MKRVFVCSPLRGDYERNLELAKRACLCISRMGDAPFAPHVLYTQFLDDNNPNDRDSGIESGIMFLRTCDQLVYFGDHISFGMEQEIQVARECHIPIVHMTWEEVDEVLGK